MFKINNLASLLQFFFSKEIGEQCGAQITLTRGRKDNHNILIGKGFVFLKFQRGGHGGTGGNPRQDAFFFHQTACGGNGFVVGDGDHFIDQLQIEVTRNKTCADTLNFMRARFQFFTCQRLSDDRRIGGFYRDGNQI